MKNQYNIVLLFFILAGLISCSTTHKLCESNKVKLKVKKALEQETSAYVAYLDSVKGKDSTRVVLISKYTEKGTVFYAFENHNFYFTNYVKTFAFDSVPWYVEREVPLVAYKFVNGTLVCLYNNKDLPDAKEYFLGAIDFDYDFYSYSDMIDRLEGGHWVNEKREDEAYKVLKKTPDIYYVVYRMDKRGELCIYDIQSTCSLFRDFRKRKIKNTKSCIIEPDYTHNE